MSDKEYTLIDYVRELEEKVDRLPVFESRQTIINHIINDMRKSLDEIQALIDRRFHIMRMSINHISKELINEGKLGSERRTEDVSTVRVD